MDASYEGSALTGAMEDTIDVAKLEASRAPTADNVRDHLANFNGFDMRGVPGNTEASLTLTAEAVKALSPPPAALAHLLDRLGVARHDDNRVAFILRDEPRQTFVVRGADDTSDTLVMDDKSIFVRVAGAVREFVLWREPASVMEADRRAYVLVEEVLSLDIRSTTTYTPNAIELTPVTMTDTPASIPTNADGFDLNGGGGSAVTLTLNESVADMASAPPAILREWLERSLGIPDDANNKILFVSRIDANTQTFDGDLVDTTIDVSVEVSDGSLDLVRSYDVYSEDDSILDDPATEGTDESNDIFVLVEKPPVLPVLDISRITGEEYTGAGDDPVSGTSATILNSIAIPMATANGSIIVDTSDFTNVHAIDMGTSDDANAVDLFITETRATGVNHSNMPAASTVKINSVGDDPPSVASLHDDIADTNKFLFVLRDRSNQRMHLAGFARGETFAVRLGTSSGAVAVFRIYNNKATDGITTGIAHVIVQVLGGADGVSLIADISDIDSIRISGQDYTGRADDRIRDASATTLDIADIGASTTSLEIDITDLSHVDGLYMGSATGSASVRLLDTDLADRERPNASSVRIGSSVGAPTLNSLHNDIQSASKVFLVFRSNNMQKTTLVGFTRIATVWFRIGSTLSPFALYQGSNSVAHVLVQEVDAADADDVTIVPDLVTTSIGNYDGSTGVIGTAGQIDQVQVVDNQIFHTASAPYKIESVEVWDMDSSGSEVTLTISASNLDASARQGMASVTDATRADIPLEPLVKSLYSGIGAKDIAIIITRDMDEEKVDLVDFENTGDTVEMRVDRVVRTFSIYRDVGGSSSIDTTGDTAYVIVQQDEDGDDGVTLIASLEFDAPIPYIGIAISTNVAANTLDSISIADTNYGSPPASDISNINAIEVTGSTTLTVTSPVLDGLAAATAGSWPTHLHPHIDEVGATTNDRILFVLRADNTQKVRVSGLVLTVSEMKVRTKLGGGNFIIKSFEVYSSNAGGITASDSNNLFLFVEKVDMGPVTIIPTLDFEEDSLTYTGTAISSTNTDAGTLDKVGITSTADGNINNASHFPDVNALVVSGTTTLTLYENVVNALNDAHDDLLPDFISTGLATDDIDEDTDKILFILRTDDMQEVRVAGYQDTTVDIELRLENEAMLTTFSIYAKHATIGNSANTSFVFVEDVASGPVSIIPTLGTFEDRGVFPGTDEGTSTRDSATINSDDTPTIDELDDGLNAIVIMGTATVTLRETVLDDMLAADSAIWPDFIATGLVTNNIVETSDKILFVFRDTAEIRLTGLVKAMNILIRTGGSSSTTIETFSIYSQNATIGDSGNDVFLFVEQDSGGDDGVAIATELTINDIAYDAINAITGSASALDVADVPTTGVAGGFTFNATHFNDVDGVNLANSDVAITLRVSNTQIDSLTHTASAAGLDALHTGIDGTDKVLLVLRDDNNQTVQVSSGLMDTGEIVYGVISDVTRSFRVYGENATIMSGDTAFLLVEIVGTSDDVSTITVKDLTITTPTAAYSGSGDIAGTATNLDVANVPTTGVTGGILTFEADHFKANAVDGVDLSVSTKPIAMVVTATEMGDLDDDASGVTNGDSLDELHAEIATSGEQALLVLRDASEQRVYVDGLHLRPGNVYAEIDNLIRVFKVYSNMNDATGTDFLIVEVVGGSDGVSTIQSITINSITGTGAPYADANAPDGTDGSSTNTLDEIDLDTTADRTYTSAHLTSIEALDMSAATGTLQLTVAATALDGATYQNTSANIVTATGSLAMDYQIASGDKVLFILRDASTEYVHADGFTTADGAVIPIKVGSNIIDFSVYKDGDSSAFLLIQQDSSGSDGVIQTVASVLKNDKTNTYTGVTYTATGGTTPSTANVDIAKVTSSVGVAAAHFSGATNKMDGFDLSGNGAKVMTLTLPIAQVVNVGWPARPSGLPSLHPAIDGTDKVAFVLRDNATQAVSVTGGNDTGVILRIKVASSDFRDFRVYSQNAAIANTGNTAFVLVQEAEDTSLSAPQGCSTTYGGSSPSSPTCASNAAMMDRVNVSATTTVGNNHLDGVEIVKMTSTSSTALTITAANILTFNPLHAEVRDLYGPIAATDHAIIVLRASAKHRVIHTNLSDTGDNVKFKIGSGSLTTFSVYTNGATGTAYLILQDVPPLPIVLWNSGSTTGDFGFNRCQTQLNAAGMGAALRGDGYTRAVLFGSTNTHHFVEINTDEHALGKQSGTYFFATHATDLAVRVATYSSSTLSYTNQNLTLSQILAIDTNNGNWRNSAGNVIAAVTGGTGLNSQFWSFSKANGRKNSVNCNDAGSNTDSYNGSTGSTERINRYPQEDCSSTKRVLCIAR